MPSTSDAQHGFMGMVAAQQRGELDMKKIRSRRMRQKIRRAARGMTREQVRDFTRKA